MSNKSNLKKMASLAIFLAGSGTAQSLAADGSVPLKTAIINAAAFCKEMKKDDAALKAEIDLFDTLQKCNRFGLDQSSCDNVFRFVGAAASTYVGLGVRTQAGALNNAFLDSVRLFAGVEEHRKYIADFKKADSGFAYLVRDKERGLLRWEVEQEKLKKAQAEGRVLEVDFSKPEEVLKTLKQAQAQDEKERKGKGEPKRFLVVAKGSTPTTLHNFQTQDPDARLKATYGDRGLKPFDIDILHDLKALDIIGAVNAVDGNIGNVSEFLSWLDSKEGISASTEKMLQKWHEIYAKKATEAMVKQIASLLDGQLANSGAAIPEGGSQASRTKASAILQFIEGNKSLLESVRSGNMAGVDFNGLSSENQKKVAAALEKWASSGVSWENLSEADRKTVLESKSQFVQDLQKLRARLPIGLKPGAYFAFLARSMVDGNAAIRSKATGLLVRGTSLGVGGALIFEPFLREPLQYLMSKVSCKNAPDSVEALYINRVNSSNCSSPKYVDGGNVTRFTALTTEKRLEALKKSDALCEYYMTLREKLYSRAQEAIRIREDFNLATELNEGLRKSLESGKDEASFVFRSKAQKILLSSGVVENRNEGDQILHLTFVKNAEKTSWILKSAEFKAGAHTVSFSFDLNKRGFVGITVNAAGRVTSRSIWLSEVEERVEAAREPFWSNPVEFLQAKGLASIIPPVPLVTDAATALSDDYAFNRMKETFILDAYRTLLAVPAFQASLAISKVEHQKALEEIAQRIQEELARSAQE